MARIGEIRLRGPPPTSPDTMLVDAASVMVDRKIGKTRSRPCRLAHGIRGSLGSHVYQPSVARPMNPLLAPPSISETSATTQVGVLDDAHDEGEETFTVAPPR